MEPVAVVGKVDKEIKQGRLLQLLVQKRHVRKILFCRFALLRLLFGQLNDGLNADPRFYGTAIVPCFFDIPFDILPVSVIDGFIRPV